MAFHSVAAQRAIYYRPEIAFDRPVPKVEPIVFSAERAKAFDPATATGLIPLDQGEAIGCDWPATTPSMLAQYVVIRPGESIEVTLSSGGDIYHVVRGGGRTGSGDEVVEWTQGDTLCLPGGVPAHHSSAEGAILLLVNDEPLLRYLGARADEARAAKIPVTLFQASETSEGLREVHGRNGEQRAAGKSVVYVTTPFADRRIVTASLLASINSLEPGGDQRAHRHSSAALTLSMQGEGVFSRVDGQEVPWEPDTVILTPSFAVHSHHNRGRQMMLSFVVQDTGLHTQLRTTNFAWTE